MTDLQPRSSNTDSTGAPIAEGASKRLATTGAAATYDVRLIPLTAIVPAIAQARSVWDQDELTNLAASIRQQGILQPITVRPRHDGSYMLVLGERRYRAAEIAGLNHIPAMIAEMSDEAAALAGLMENLQRQDLSPIEEGEALARLLTLPGYSIRNIGKKLGLERVSKGYVEDRIRLARAPEDVRAMVRQRPQTLTHARELCSVQNQAVRRDAIKRTLAGMPLRE